MSQHIMCPSKSYNKGVTVSTHILSYQDTSISEHAYWRVLSQNTLSTITIIPASRSCIHDKPLYSRHVLTVTIT